MSMVCPQCMGRYEQKLVCPRCRVRLDFQDATSATVPAPSEDAGSWQQTPWGRIILGLVLAQGLYQGFHQLLQAGLMAAGEDAGQGIWAALSDVAAVQALQAACLLVGGLLAGAGQRRGAAYGAFIGVFNGVLLVVLSSHDRQEVTPVSFYGLPLLHAAVGVLAGFIGSRIWRPLPSLPQLQAAPAPTPLAIPRGPSRFAGKIAWARVLVGVAVGVCGTHWANTILDLVLEAADGKLAVETHLQARLVTWEITGLAMLASGAIGGASTRNSLKQGLVIGLAAAFLLVGIRYWSGKVVTPQNLAVTGVTSFGLALAGSWFGGQFFPPTFHVARRRERRFGSAAF